MAWKVDYKCQQVFRIAVLIQLVALALSNEKEHQNEFLCRRCGETIANHQQLSHYTSPLAVDTWNATLLGVPRVNVQLFENPQKQRFNVVTFTTANIHAHEEAYSEASWYPGNAWRICTCPQCKTHLGWKFQPVNFNHVTHSEEDTFVGIILDRLIEEKQGDSILYVPNSYKS
uniref:CULT domain-containing protein n=1 Tax=Ciona savignyi TaxID=51511 RepID=H2YTW4_CIOSA